jgi:hypothetical protein
MKKRKRKCTKTMMKKKKQKHDEKQTPKFKTNIQTNKTKDHNQGVLNEKTTLVIFQAVSCLFNS